MEGEVFMFIVGFALGACVFSKSVRNGFASVFKAIFKK